jgi:hypothetical protein
VKQNITFESSAATRIDTVAHALVQPGLPPPKPEPEEVYEATACGLNAEQISFGVDYLMGHLSTLKDKESGFVCNLYYRIRSRPSFMASERQVDWLMSIYDRLRRNAA